MMCVMGGLSEKPTFFGFVFEIFYKTEIVLFSAITTERPYPRKKTEILMQLNFINIYIIIRGKDWTKIQKHFTSFRK